MAASDIYQQGTKLFYSPTPGTYQAISDPAQLQTLAKQGAVKTGSAYLPLPTGSAPVGANATPLTAQGGIQQPPTNTGSPVASPAAQATPSVNNQPTGGSNQAFQTAFGQLMNNAQKNQGLQDQMYALIRAKYDNNPQITPDMPLAVQQAVQNRDQSMIDFQISALRSQIQGRSTDMTNSLQYLVQGYQQDQAAVDANKAKAFDNFDAAINKYPQLQGVMSEAGRIAVSNGQMPPQEDILAVSNAYSRIAADAQKTTVVPLYDDYGNRVGSEVMQGGQVVSTFGGGTPGNSNGNNGNGGGSPVWTDPISNKSYDWSTYAVNDDGTPNMQAVTNINNALSAIGTSFTNDNVDALSSYINDNTMNGKTSPVTAAMIQKAANDNGVSWEALSAVLQSESNFGTNGSRAIDNKNPGNVGNTNNGSNKPFATWQDGVEAAAKALAGRVTSSGQGSASQGTPLPDAGMENQAQNIANYGMDPAIIDPKTPRSGKTEKISADLLKRVQQINPNFKPGPASAQYKFANDSSNQSAMVSINRVLPNIDVIESLSDSWSRGNFTPLNDALMKLGFITSDQKISNLGQLQNIIGDELGTALGSQSGSDLKTQLGLNVIDPKLSPSTFKSNMEQIKNALNNSKQAYLKQAGNYSATLDPSGSTSSSGGNSNDLSSQVQAAGYDYAAMKAAGYTDDAIKKAIGQ